MPNNEAQMNNILSNSTKVFFEEFCKRLNQKKKNLKSNKSDCKIIDKVLSCDEQLIESLFGKIGKKIHIFFSSVDRNHPDLSNCYDGSFKDTSELSNFINEVIISYKLLKKKEFAHVQNILMEHSTSYIEKKYNSIIKIDSPEKNRCNVRFVNDRDKIEKIRCQKKMQFIDLHGVYKKGMSYYTSHSQDFYKHLRFDESLFSELKDMEIKADRYEQIGCLVLAQEIRKNLKNLKDHVDNTYFGFNRITMSSSAIILARNIGFEMKDENINYQFSSDNFKISISNDYLHGVKFIGDSNLDTLEYQPIIYPLSDFKSIATDTINGVLNTLDNFPEVGNKPIFDFFGIIVPSVKIPEHHSHYGFIDLNGCERKHKNYNDCKLDFDRYMIENNIFYPIVVAEKDHKCYFITYWL